MDAAVPETAGIYTSDLFQARGSLDDGKSARLKASMSHAIFDAGDQMTLTTLISCVLGT